MAIGVFRRQNNMAARTIIVALMTLLLTAAATADVLRVPLEYQSIQEAVMFSAEADTILISDGLYQEHLSIPGRSLTIASRFLLDGDTTHIGATLLDGAHQGTVVRINGDRGRWYRFVGLTHCCPIVILFPVAVDSKPVSCYSVAVPAADRASIGCRIELP